MFTALRRWLCPHQEMLREHRELGGRQFVFYVCHRCGYATPMLMRTEEDEAKRARIASAARPGRV